MLKAYLAHFNIKTSLSATAAEFLKSDLILLRIFCEIHEDTDIGYVSDVYKGDVFEKYLTKKIEEFPRPRRQETLHTIYKICARMLETEEFSKISISDFNTVEMEIIEQLIGEDIVLRREVPTTGLSSVGIENISFTYDELRDFILAYFTTDRLMTTDQNKVKTIFEKLSGWPVHEGFFRYSYVLARKQEAALILGLCEASSDFMRHYVDILPLLPVDVQNDQDVERVKSLLSDCYAGQGFYTTCRFLFHKRDLSKPLNIQILVDHVRALPDDEFKRFLRAMFSPSMDYWRYESSDDISRLLRSFLRLPDEQKVELEIPLLVFFVYLATVAGWEEREELLNKLAQLQNFDGIEKALDYCKEARSGQVRRCVDEITAS